MKAALHAEWTKLRTVPGPAGLLLATVAVTVALSALVVAVTRCPAGAACQVDTARLSLTGIQLGQAAAAILAVGVLSAEYGTGMIRVTLAAMPRRITLLAAKAVLVTGLVLAAGSLGVAGGCWPGWLILPGHGFTAARGFPPLSLRRRAGAAGRRGSVLYLAFPRPGPGHRGGRAGRGRGHRPGPRPAPPTCSRWWPRCSARSGTGIWSRSGR